MIIDILSGVLSGASFLDHVNRFYSQDNKCMNVGHYFVVIDPKIVYDETFYSTMDKYIDEIHSSGENVFFPGEMNIAIAQQSEKLGIELMEETAVRLGELFDRFGVGGIEEK